MFLHAVMNTTGNDTNQQQKLLDVALCHPLPQIDNANGPTIDLTAAVVELNLA